MKKKAWQLFPYVLCLGTVLSGCSSDNTVRDNFYDASFELCGTEVKVYSVDDDGQTRIVCADDSKFMLDGEETLKAMSEINMTYCTGEGLAQFNEADDRYFFKCKSGEKMSITKED